MGVVFRMSSRLGSAVRFKRQMFGRRKHRRVQAKVPVVDLCYQFVNKFTRLFLVYCVVCFVVNNYFIACLLLRFETFNNPFGTCIDTLKLALANFPCLWFGFKFRKVRQILHQLITELLQFPQGSAVVATKLTRFKINLLLFVVFGVSLCIIELVTILSNASIKKGYISYLCYGCNATALSDWLGYPLAVTQVASFDFCPVASPVLFVIWYCFATSLLAELIQLCGRDIGQQPPDSAYAVASDRFKTIKKLTDLLNATFQSWVLFFLGFTLFSMSSGVVWFFQSCSYICLEPGLIISSALPYLMLIVLLTATLSSASKVKEEWDSMYTSISDVNLNVLLLKSEVPNITMSAGGCLAVSRGLMFTLVGLFVTYLVVSVQFDSKLMNLVQNG